ncbi:hypothetical protein ACFELO_07780 [Oceanicaulis sp. LC35]|uniref:hypothetical protein n=1 Tax=Oceanicaulis sp. LC35 TaxID=3349635 RepID=UPI003F863DEC
MRAGTTPSRTYSERYGARSPWLVERWRVVVYLIWRALFALFRPVLFLSLCAGALFCLYRGLDALPAGALTPPQSLSDRFEAALHDAVHTQGGKATLTQWRSELDASLAPVRSGTPDLPRARSFALSLPDLMGREALALHLMRAERRPELMQADLVAMPVWRRQHIITGVLEARLQDTSNHRDPIWLQEASPQVQRRYARAEALYGPSLNAAQAWFHSPEGLALNLGNLPGVTRSGASDGALVLPDARELVVQGCALARAQNQRVSACERVPLGRQAPDAIRAALALSLYDDELEASSVRLALAARAAGRLEGAWLEELMLGPSGAEGEMKLLTALMPVLAEADRIHARPETCLASCARAQAEFHQSAELDAARRNAWFSAYDQIRREEGALVALRVSDVLHTDADVLALARLSTISEGRLLAGRIVLGDELVALDASEIFFSAEFDRPEFVLACVLAGLALLLLGIVLIQGRFRRSGGAPGALERLDGEVSRLILGRNL